MSFYSISITFINLVVDTGDIGDALTHVFVGVSIATSNPISVITIHSTELIVNIRLVTEIYIYVTKLGGLILPSKNRFG